MLPRYTVLQTYICTISTFIVQVKHPMPASLLVYLTVKYFIHSFFVLTADSFLEKFPYCIPSMFSALISLVGVVTVGCLLPDKPENKQ